MSAPLDPVEIVEEWLILAREDLLDLSEYAVDTRYPRDSVEALAVDDAERALAAAKKVEERVMHALHPPPKLNR